MPHLTLQAKQALTEARRRQILKAALRVFAAKGYPTATIQDIARAARVAEGTIYNYFRSKDDLLAHIPRQAIMEGVLEDLAARLARVRTADEVERVLQAFGGEAIRRIRTHIRFVKVMLSATPHLSASARQQYMRLLPLAAARVLEAHLREGMRTGLYRADLDPAVAARALPMLMIASVMVLEVLGGAKMTDAAYATVVRENVRLFLTGVLRGTHGSLSPAGAHLARALGGPLEGDP
ncbi:MAG: helix-turn-helix domain-containing protein [Armatimonadota bacterium]|nr:helix-turn-helix domain-containing protein [Armatimonadota bacterium]